MSLISKKIDKIKPSATVTINSKSRDLKASGLDVVSLAAGEPDFDTPEHIKKGGISSINKGILKYTAVAGIVQLRNAIAKKYNDKYALNIDATNITTGVGGKGVLFNILMASLDPEDEVIIPAPYWVSYTEMVSMCDGTSVIIDTSEENNFKMTAKQLEAAITDKTKWLVFNSPSNPTGAVYSREEIAELSAVLLKYKHVNILSDDVYEDLVYKNEFVSFASVEPQLIERIVFCSAVSKTYAMTGWRLGYAVSVNKALVNAINSIQSQICSHTAVASQYAGLAALEGDHSFLKEFKDIYKRRLALVMNWLNNSPYLSAPEPEGAFYTYINVSKLIGKKTTEGKKLENDIDVCSFILDKALVALVPGEAFGLSPYVRLSYAASDEILKKSFQRIDEALKTLQ